MRVDLRFRGVSGSERLRQHTARRIAFGLGRYASELSAVMVRFGDVNGPRGGVDQRCHVTVSGPRLGEVQAETMGADPFAAVSFAVERVARATGRRLEREHPRRDAGSIRDFAGTVR